MGLLFHFYSIAETFDCTLSALL
ncbi:protein of unknown function [Methylocaldum szegediense]|uniref:Uncharacterized protein n=1 Tax=Methylocaldum szegediense TaxID=73780 RepID=A0ABM9HYW4_9GAMM|nr:protein of unknown function [Methylocaldum szegediense]CAI8823137.1 protein of unknown function [Methylocaldum szegediense]